jgi:hypothetical protein
MARVKRDVRNLGDPIMFHLYGFIHELEGLVYQKKANR